MISINAIDDNTVTINNVNVTFNQPCAHYVEMTVKRAIKNSYGELHITPDMLIQLNDVIDDIIWSNKQDKYEMSINDVVDNALSAVIENSRL